MKFWPFGFARWVLSCCIASLVAACGGGSDTGSSSTGSGGASGGSSGGSTLPSGVQTLTATGTVLNPLELGSDGATWLTWRENNSVFRQSYVTGKGWQTQSSLANLPIAAVGAYGTATAVGPWTAMAWLEIDPNDSFQYSLWVQVGGPQASVAQNISRTPFNVDPSGAKLAVSEKGEVSVFWAESIRAGSHLKNLVSRHWSPSSGWGPINELELSKGITPPEVYQLPDGRALLVYEESVSGDVSWVRVIDQSGNASPAIVLNESEPGNSYYRKVVVSGNDVIVSWEHSSAMSGSDCAMSRVLRSTGWTTSACVGPRYVGGFLRPVLRVGPGGHVLLAWRGSEGIEGATYDRAAGTWNSPQTLGKKGANEYLGTFDSLVCADGSAAILWDTLNGRSSTMWTGVSTPQGSWKDRVELAVTEGEFYSPTIKADAACNRTAVWGGPLDSKDGVFARRIMASDELQPLQTLAKIVALPTRYAVLLSLEVEAAGPATVMWREDESGQYPVRWQRFE